MPCIHIIHTVICKSPKSHECDVALSFVNIHKKSPYPIDCTPNKVFWRRTRAGGEREISCSSPTWSQTNRPIHSSSQWGSSPAVQHGLNPLMNASCPITNRGLHNHGLHIWLWINQMQNVSVAVWAASCSIILSCPLLFVKRTTGNGFKSIFKHLSHCFIWGRFPSWENMYGTEVMCLPR